MHYVKDPQDGLHLLPHKDKCRFVGRKRVNILKRANSQRLQKKTLSFPVLTTTKTTQIQKQIDKGIIEYMDHNKGGGVFPPSIANSLGDNFQ